MSKFGKTLFSGGRFIFWTLAPILFIVGISLPLFMSDWTKERMILIIIMELIIIFMILALYKPDKFKWAARFVTGGVFIAYSGYVIDMIFIKDKPITFFGPSSEATPRNALLGFIVIGIPCLIYTLFGRFTIRPEIENDEDDDDTT